MVNEPPKLSMTLFEALYTQRAVRHYAIVTSPTRTCKQFSKPQRERPVEQTANPGAFSSCVTRTQRSAAEIGFLTVGRHSPKT